MLLRHDGGISPRGRGDRRTGLESPDLWGPLTKVEKHILTSVWTGLTQQGVGAPVPVESVFICRLLEPL